MKRLNAYCSFCRKSNTEVGPLVEGPEEVYICSECIQLCQSIIDQERHRRNPSHRPFGPTLIREKLDQFVSGQDEAKDALALAGGYRNDGRGRVLLISPSRSAKVFLARALAHILEVPFVAGDSRDLVKSKHGSVDVSPLLFNLLQAGEFDLEAAQQGVVYVDGAERQDVQTSLLRLWQENTNHAVKGVPLAVRGILFVCGGNFVGLDEAITRLGRHSEQPVTVEELTAVGVQPDWVGCLGGIARVSPLDETSLERIVHWVDFRVDAGPAESAAADDRGGS